MDKSFANPDENIQFSKLRGIDLQDMLVETENTMLEYRDTLNLPLDITFGTEIEYEKCSRSRTDKFVERNLSEWKSKSDSTVSSGGEIISPIMVDSIEHWNQLRKICQFLNKKGADTSHRAGGHIHIGADALENDIESWRLFLKLYTAYESTLFRFIYGDKLKGRETLMEYAQPIATELYEKMDQINQTRYVEYLGDIIKGESRYVALNFKNVHFYDSGNPEWKNTIEFRSPNSSTNHIIWQNNINAFTKMILSSRDKEIDEEFLDYKLSKDFIPYNNHKYIYDDINLKSVLEFVDLAFDNNLDKIYFLRQYLKSFQDNHKLTKATSAKRFSR